MNGPHDLGGAQGFGQVRPDDDSLAFHEPWEPDTLALTLAMGATGSWNLDAMRFARESLPPARYLSSSYYQIWRLALEQLLVARGLVTEQELAEGRPLEPAKPVARVLAASEVAGALARGAPTEREPQAPAQFRVGDNVRARLMHPTGHTRLPRYIRGRPGTIADCHGAHIYPDTHAHGQGESPRWLYSVRFEASELWGADTTASAVYVDCWEPYLEAIDR